MVFLARFSHKTHVIIEAAEENEKKLSSYFYNL